MEAADDICYAVIDIEDAVELGILSFKEASKLLLKIFDPDVRADINSMLGPQSMHRVNFARMRGLIFDKLISAAIESFLSVYKEILSGICEGNLIDILPAKNRSRKLINEAKIVGRQSIYTDTKKVEIEIGCYATLDTLLSEFCSAALDQAQVLKGGTGNRISWKSGQILRLLGDHAPAEDNAPPDGWTEYQCVRRIMDFISGMTDNYAVYIAKQLQGSGFAGGQRP